ncbi:MAG: FAD-linked oxidase C-terminal domain-containing protein, partial [Novosphingobium sp.]|uniref:FAD-linked oxidase C-terminal domain-containing protein n=1 Tax=Novosphingobium sp. TaxID=1874826 RepID=UPI003C7ACB55
FAAVQRLFVEIGRQLGPGLTAFEVMWPSFYEPMVASGRHTPPLPGGHGCYVIAEMSGTDPEADPARFEAVLGALLESGTVVDAVIASSQTQADQIWAIRDDIPGLMMFTMPSVTFDVSLPIRDMDRYVADLTKAAQAEFGETLKLVVFGHIGDGNLHILMGAQPFTAETKHRIEELVYAPLQALGGSVSAEHGIGIEKRDWLAISRSGEEITLMRTLKAALDPKGILNPGKVLS